MLRKIVIVIVAVLLLLVITLGIFLSGGPEFPHETDQIIAEAIQSGPPELVQGATGYAQSGNIRIWYEVNTPQQQGSGQDKDQPKDTVLLIMGTGMSSMLWPPDFIQSLLNKGYQVIRFDNRGTGMSDWLENWEEEHPYSLEAMAIDALAVLDAAGIKQAHVIGTSLGGMIGQRLAISHGERVLSLVAMSTSGDILDPEFARLQQDYSLDIIRLILKYALSGSEAGMIKMTMGVIDMMTSDGLQTKDVREVADLVLYEMRKRRGLNQHAMAQHFAAMQVSGSRLNELSSIRCPVLVIHGTVDTTINIAHAKKYAARIPTAQTLWLEGEGHIIRDRQMPVVMDAIFKLIESQPR